MPLYNNPCAKARSVNQTSAAYVAKVPTATEPSGDAGTATGSSITELGTQTIIPKSSLVIIPYGVGSNNNTFSVRVIGWRQIGALWIPFMLCEFLCTISTAAACTGVAGQSVAATEFFCDTIAVTYGNNNVSIEVVSNGADLPAHAVVALKGSQKAELSFTTGASATSANALISVI